MYRFAIYRDLYVDWAIMLWATWDNLQHLLSEGTPAERRRIERTDCCESQIHRHLFTINSDPDDDQGQRIEITPLRSGDAIKVDREFDTQLALVSRQWEERTRRWLDG